MDCVTGKKILNTVTGCPVHPKIHDIPLYYLFIYPGCAARSLFWHQTHADPQIGTNSQKSSLQWLYIA